MKKLIVNENACIGCGSCIAIDGDHFDFDDRGLSVVISNDNLNNETLQCAIDSCPTCAITLVDGEKKAPCNCGDNCTCGDDCDCNDEHRCSDDCTCNTCNCEGECTCNPCTCESDCTCEGKCTCEGDCTCEDDCGCE